MKLFDSNLVIYSVSDQYKQLRPLLATPDAYISAITKVEALGYHKLPQLDKEYFEVLFTTIVTLPVSEAVINLATNLRQRRKMSLGDAIIAATALLNGFELYTRNTADFTFIPGLVVVNPIDR